MVKTVHTSRQARGATPGARRPAYDLGARAELPERVATVGEDVNATLRLKVLTL
jgi:hypothetical protein